MMTTLTTAINAQEGSGTSDCPELELSDEHIQLVGQMASPPQTGPKYAPSSGTIRVLIIFARFSDDNYEPNNPNWKLSDTLANFPEAQNIIDPFGTAPSNYKKGTLSHYFHKMSNGQLNFVGDIYPRIAVFPKTRLWYVQNGREFGHANADLLDSLNRDDPSLNFAIYDNNTMGLGTDGNTSNVPDGKVDMIYIIYRNIVMDLSASTTPTFQQANLIFKGQVWDGIASLGQSHHLTLDGKTINFQFPGSGITIDLRGLGQDKLKKRLIVNAHEFGHYLFGWAHGGTHPTLGIDGLMGGAGRDGCMHSLERYELGWLALVPVSQTQTSVVSDYATQHTAYSLNLPQGGAYIIENHQRIGGNEGGYYDSAFFKSKGIHVTYSSNGSLSGSKVKIMAEGEFDWTTTQWVLNPWASDPLIPNSWLPIFSRSKSRPNPNITILGSGGRNRRVYITTTTPNPISNVPGSYLMVFTAPGVQGYTADHISNPYEAFTETYTKVYSQWSNPQSRANIGFEVLSHNSTNATYNLRFYVGASSVAQNAPGKPQDLVLVNAGQAGQHPILRWSANKEPFLTGYNIYRHSTKLNGLPITDTTYTDYQRVISNVKSGSNFEIYKVSAVGNGKESARSDSATTRAIDGGDLPFSNNQHPFELEQNYPNPFNPSTRIAYQIPKTSEVQLKVYDVLGREVETLVSGVQQAGRYEVVFNASRLASGIYFYRLQAGGVSQTMRMVMVK